MVLHCETEVTINAPATLLKSLVVNSSAGTDTLSPPTGKRIVVLGVLFGNNINTKLASSWPSILSAQSPGGSFLALQFGSGITPVQFRARY